MKAMLGAVLLALESCASAPTPAQHPPAAGTAPFADLLMSAEGCTSSPRAVSRAEAVADLAAMERILRGGYAGYEVLGRSGLDWDRLFREARADLERLAEPIEPARLRQTLATRLSALGDNHVALWDYSPHGWTGWSSTGHHQDAFTADVVLARDGDTWVVQSGHDAGARLEECAGWSLAEIVRPSVGPDLSLVYRLIVLSRGAPSPLDCRVHQAGESRRVALAMRRLRVGWQEPRGAPTFEQHRGLTPRLRLRSLSEARAGALKAFAASARALRGVRSLLLDVRGNRGGNDDWVTRWFVELTSGELRYATIEELQSEVTLQGDVNTAVCDRAQGGDSEGRDLVERELRRTQVDLESARRQHGRPYRRWRARTPVARGKAPAPFAGRLVLLADARCASSCETFFLYARQIAGSVTVGENTGGVGAFGDVRLYRLPHSGLGFSAGKKWFHTEDPRALAPEGRGHLPDLWLDSDRAPELAERLAECLAETECATRFRPVLDAQRQPLTDGLH